MRYPRLRSGPGVAALLRAAVAAIVISAAVPCSAIRLQMPFDKGQWWGPQTYDKHDVYRTYNAKERGIDWYYTTSHKDTYVFFTIGTSLGKTLRAMHDGTVVQARYKTAYGYTVILRSTENSSYLTLYAHMNSIVSGLKEGVTKINAGDKIGTVGGSGNGKSSPHLHFELLKETSGGWVPQDISNLVIDGQSVDFHDWHYYWTDGSGIRHYQANALQSRFLYGDDQPPTISITTTPSAPNSSGWYTAPSSIVSWVATDPSGIDHTKVWWDGEAVTPVSASGSWTMREGVHTFHVHAADKVGNESPTGSLTTKLDKTTPKMTVTAPAPNQMYTTAQLVKWSVTDTVSGVNTVSGVAWVDTQWDSGTVKRYYSASGSVTVPKDNVLHTFKIRSGDNAGNTTPWSTYGPFGVALVGPDIDFEGPDECVWLNTPQTISWTVTGATSVSLQWDAGSAVSVTNPGSAPVPEGVHTAKLVASGPGGIDVDGGQYWLDLHAPAYQSGSFVTPAESGSLSILTGTWQFTDLQPGVNQVSGIEEYEYWIGTTPGGSDVLESTSNSEPWAWAPNLTLEEGATYYITVRSRDNAGNWSDPVTSSGILATAGAYETAGFVNSGGTSVIPRTSDGCQLVDSMGQFAVGESVCELGWAEHGYWHSDAPVPPEESIAGARLQYDGTPVALGTADRPIVVTAPTSAFAQRFYVEQYERSGGIAVEYGPLGGPALLEGDWVWLTGQMQTVGQERVICNAQAFVLSHLDPGLAPLMMASKAVGGNDDNPLTTDIPGSVGLYNVGLLAKIFGRVNAADPGGQFFYLDDGAGLNGGILVNGVPAKGIRVCLADLAAGNSIAPLSNGTYAAVTGIVSVSDVSGPLRAQIRPRTQADVLPIAE